MQIFSRRRAPRHDDSRPPAPSVADAVATIGATFESTETSVTEVPAAAGHPSAPDAPHAIPAALHPSLDSSAGTIQDAPAVTRRELREREAREREAQEREAPKREGPERAAGPAAPERSTLTPADDEPPRRGAVRSTDRRSTDRRSTNRTSTNGRSTDRRAPSSRRRRRSTSRSARLPRDTRPGRKPRVAASVTAPSSRAGRAARIKRRLLSDLVSVGAMAGVGLILVSTTVPANAFSRPEASTESVVDEVSVLEDSQELTVESVAAPTVVRDGYTVISQQQQMAAKYGNRLMLFTNNPNGTVQWPFPTGAPITSGFGGRQVAGCGFCSTFHEGLDFTPGAGIPIQSIADGVVSDVQVAGAYGNHVEVEHFINGQLVTSTYSHMQYGSIDVAEGQAITVGQTVGAVGSTGASTGPHLHLEIHLDGTPVDPFAWLQANAN